jgi:integrase
MYRTQSDDSQKILNNAASSWHFPQLAHYVESRRGIPREYYLIRWGRNQTAKRWNAESRNILARRIDMERTLSNRRRYLTQDELKKLIKATRKGRYGRRDATLMLLMARHGLRVTEAVDLRWDQIDFPKGHLHVRRLKGGIHSVHPIQGDELRALRELRREQQAESTSKALPVLGFGHAQRGRISCLSLTGARFRKS